MTGLDVTLFASTFTTLFVNAFLDPFGALPALALTSHDAPRTPHRRVRASSGAATSSQSSLFLASSANTFWDSFTSPSRRCSLWMVVRCCSRRCSDGRTSRGGARRIGLGSVNVALVPLGVPLLAGQVPFIAVMLSAQDAARGGVSIAAVVIAVLLVHLVEFVTPCLPTRFTVCWRRAAPYSLPRSQECYSPRSPCSS